LAQPSIDLATKVPVERAVARPELALVSVREGSDNFGLDRDSMVVDLAVEGFAQSDDVLV
jgi:hypothetical protein